jgi:hypothetical protein
LELEGEEKGDWAKKSFLAMVVSESEALRRAFLDFAETIQSLGPHIARSGGEDEEYEPDPFAQVCVCVYMCVCVCVCVVHTVRFVIHHPLYIIIIVIITTTNATNTTSFSFSFSFFFFLNPIFNIVACHRYHS